MKRRTFIKQADVLIVFCRRWGFVAEQASVVRNAICSGKPVLGIRTASHAFQFFKEFDRMFSVSTTRDMGRVAWR